MYFRKQSPAVVRHDAVTNEMLFHFVFYPRLGLTAILLWGVFLLRARGKSPSWHQESNQLRSLLCWKWSKHSTHTAPWTQEKDLCCLTSRIHLYIPVMPSQETWEIKTTNRIGYYPPVTQSNLTVTITFQVIAAHLHKSSICVLPPGQLASRDLLVKLCMTDFAHSTYYRTWSLKVTPTLLQIWTYSSESTEGPQRQLRYWSTCHTRRSWESWDCSV